MKHSGICPVCGSDASDFFYKLPFELSGYTIETSIYKCYKCHSFWRSLPEKLDIELHFESINYNTDAQCELIRDKRYKLFFNIGTLLDEYSSSWPNEPRLLDIGCSYGHMIEFFSEKGFFCSGVEPVSRLRKVIDQKGIPVYAGIDTVPKNDIYHVISFIDSLYYMQRPFDALSNAMSMLADNGIIIIRIANRTPFLRALSPIKNYHLLRIVFGDQLTALSHNGILHIIRALGGKVERCLFYEKRDIDGVIDYILYRGLGLFASIISTPVSPGIIYIISKK